jgi:hypothetical protein
LSIFYKILITPLLGFFIFALFLNYQQRIIYQNSIDIQKIKDNIFPALKLSKDNISILDDINRGYEDILVTAEVDGFKDIYAKKDILLKNAKLLKDIYKYESKRKLRKLYIKNNNICKSFA